MWNTLRRIANNKQFIEGSYIKQEDFNLPFQQNANNTTAMFELRKYFIMNSPHTHHSQKYTNQMAHLHNQLNYLYAKQLMKRSLLVFDEPDAIDWKDTFDIKFSQRTYGSLRSAAGQGDASIDQ